MPSKRPPRGYAGSTFEEFLRTRDPDAIRTEAVGRLEAGRRQHLQCSRDALGADQQVLEAAVEKLRDRLPPERLAAIEAVSRRLAVRREETEAALAAIKDPPTVPVGGWLALGQVREMDGRPPSGGKIVFEGPEAATSLLPPISIPADGQVSVCLAADQVAELTRQGEVTVRIAATVGQRRADDPAPAQIGPGRLHQFDLLLPPTDAYRPTGGKKGSY